MEAVTHSERNLMIRMSKLLRLLTLFALATAGTSALAGAAAAQPAQPAPPPPPEPSEPGEPTEPAEPSEPPYQEPPATEPVAPAAAPVVREKKIRLSAGLLIAYPVGDNATDSPDGAGASTSPGLRVAAGYSFTPEISAHLLYRYTFVSADAEEEGLSLSTSDLGAGARYTMAGDGAQFFGEASILSSSLNFSFEGFSLSIDGFGIELRGGAAFQISGNMWLEASASYLKAMLSQENDGGEDFDESWDWISAHVDLTFRL
jgi:hypothetical protein